MKLDKEGKKHLIELEGVRLNAYLDTKKIPTIFIGNTFYIDGSKVKMGDTITMERGMILFETVLKKFEDNLNKVVKVSINQNQINSLIGFSYNIGIQAFNKSTLLKLLNKSDYKGASNEFLKWTKQKELTERRIKERDLFLK